MMPVVSGLRPLIGQFMLYLLSGGTAAIVDFGSYYLLLHWGAWYIAASVIGGILGFFTAFLIHKYIVFRKKERFLRHMTKYLIADIVNIGLTTLILYGLVEHIELGEEISKIIAMGSVALWNFFVCKYLVYT